MLSLFNTIMPVMLVVGFGYFATWKNLLNEAANEALNVYAQRFAIPCLLFLAISRVDLGASALVPLLVSYYFGAFASFGLAFLAARHVLGRSPPDAVAIAFCAFFSNTILLGIPVTERAYGVDGLAGNFAIITFHVPVCYLLGVTAMEIAQHRSANLVASTVSILSAIARNPFAIAIFLGLIVNFSKLPVPGALLDAVELLSITALPVALVGLGGTLVRYKPEGDRWTIATICLISLIVQPAIVMSTGLAFQLDQSALRSAVVTAAMAPGINAYIFATTYGTARRVVASSVLLATMASIVTATFWLNVLP